MKENFYDTNIFIEITKKRQKLRGYTSILNIVGFPKALSVDGLRILFPEKEDYLLGIMIAKKLLENGTLILAVDITIAAIAINHNLRFITRDKHFTAVKAVEPVFKLLLM